MKLRPSSLFMGGSKHVSTIMENRKNSYFMEPYIIRNHSTSVKKKIFLAGVVLVFSSLAGIFFYEYNKQGLDISSVTGETVSADALLTEFSSNEVEANKK